MLLLPPLRHSHRIHKYAAFSLTSQTIPSAERAITRVWVAPFPDAPTFASENHLQQLMVNSQARNVGLNLAYCFFCYVVNIFNVQPL